ncbi:MAG TPA: helix-turn-helix transcriptional regulator [Pseudonocardiaceae bacterium]|jgi:transcriptional regulator with XRE-family HTH domain|nr:helix-turn-helix transcriptional regulator [Pseudonocardiaceae bacterium]
MAGPTLRKRQLGMELRRLRTAAGITREVAADEIACSPTKITHLESGRNSPRKAELKVLLQLYGASVEEHAALEELRLEASERGWWSTARLPEWLAAYVGLEADASSLRTFTLELIPGLLQTEAYTRETHLLAKHMTQPDEVDRQVAARMRRQKRLTDPQPLQFSAVVSEAALRRCASHPAIAPAQLRYLVEQAGLPNVDLRILPFSAGMHQSMSGSFALLSFPDEALPDAAYQEYAVGGHLIDEQVIVARLDRLFAALRDQALGADESLVLISELLNSTE